MSTLDDIIVAERSARLEVRKERDQQVATLYPRARTFELRHAEAIGAGQAAALVEAGLPRTLTLVTPDHADPGRDQLHVGACPVLSRDLRWDAAFEELSFATSDGRRPIRGHLRLTHSRLRAFGALDIGGQSFAVQYEVKPQRYRMKVARDAAYLSGTTALITWDTQSDRWRNASWSSDYEVGFSYGVNGEEVIGGEKVYTFVAGFDDIKTGRKWDPIAFTYVGMINREQTLTYGLIAGANPPAGEGTALFPYTLRVRLSEFGYDFNGGMVTGKPGYQGTVYGVMGDWAGGNVAGLYQLGNGDSARLIAVHDRALHARAARIEQAVLDGDDLAWADLPAQVAQAAGLPRTGRLTFSADGEQIVSSSFGATGHRIHPDDALEIAALLESSELAGALRHASAMAGDDGHTLADLTRMSQFSTDADGRFFDAVQQNSMQDFYTILQNFMDPALRSTFFNPNPPPLGDLYGIAHTKGTKGTDPVQWYKSLSVAYTASALANFSADPAAKTLNALRAETWIRNETSVGDVMAAQGPLLYQRRYQDKHANLDWFLVDQKANAATYAPVIDLKVTEWIDTARRTAVGTPEEIADLEKQIKDLGEAAKKNKQYWAFALYTYTTSPAYLNMLQAILASGAEIDGSEFSQRVQRTVALLNVLDTSSYFSQQYAYLLQLFELSQILPQMVDFSNDLKNFSVAVKDIIDKFIETYINSPDPAMREAAERMQQHASSELVGRILSVLRTSAAVGYGLNNWGFLVQTFDRTCAKLFANLPAIVIKLTALAAAGALLMFFIGGNAEWDSLDGTQKSFVVVGAVNIVGQAVLAIVNRGVALSAVWDAQVGIRKNLAMFFKPSLLGKAQLQATSGLRSWLLQTSGPKVSINRMTITQWWANRKALSEAAPLLADEAGPRSRFLRAVFGGNLTQFMARALAGAFAITGIVMSAIELAKDGEPLEKAANWLFLMASVLELVAVVGGWFVAGSAVTVGGMLVSTIFAIVSVVGFVVFIVGAILLIILMTRPQPTPVENFARNQAGDLYMPYQAAIESFRLYQPLGQPQRAGVAMFPGARQDHALTINSDGTVRQGQFGQDGHTAFYMTTDEKGRVQIGAPILDTEGKPVLFALGTDDTGKVITKNAVGQDASVDTKIMWYADIQGDGSYEESAGGVRELRSAPFKLRSAHWAGLGQTRYLSLDGETGWKLTDSDPAVITFEMVVTKPQELTMNDVTWYTVAHDEQTGPALQVAGSEPRHWTVSPQLPDGLEFLPAEGTIRMRTGVNVPPAPRRGYTISVQNDVGFLQATFDLEVLVPPDELVLA